MTVDGACKLFPGAPRANVEKYLPFVLNALSQAGLDDSDMICAALATIRAETACFVPIEEQPSRFNSSGAPDGHPFDLYDRRADLGNLGPPDGECYKGRGFVQLTGRVNYHRHGQAIGLGDRLVQNPELANDPEIASRLLASFLKCKEKQIRAAVTAGDLARARMLVNGGTHGLAAFAEAFHAAGQLPENVSQPA